MKISLITPAKKHSKNGNRASAVRWAGFLSEQGHRVRIDMDYDDEPMGFFLVTDIEPQRKMARIHIYVGPDQRRYSLKASQALEQVVVPQLREMGVRTMVASQPFEQRGAYGLAKRMGFTPVPTVMLTKEI